MLDFLKHPWSKKEKLFAKWTLRHVAIAFVAGLFIASSVLILVTRKDAERVIDLREKAQKVEEVSKAPPGTKHIGGPFELVNQDGKKVSDADYANKMMLIYFGYTFCPDMCPTGLQSMSHALDQLGPDAAKLAPLFITIDPARDTPEKIKAYAAQFHPQIEALTGTDQQVAKAASAYQVYYAKGEMVDDHDYVMDHSSLIYLMAPGGTFITTFPEDVDPAEIVKAVKAHL